MRTGSSVKTPMPRIPMSEAGPANHGSSATSESGANTPGALSTLCSASSSPPATKVGSNGTMTSIRT